MCVHPAMLPMGSCSWCHLLARGTLPTMSLQTQLLVSLIGFAVLLIAVQGRS